VRSINKFGAGEGIVLLFKQKSFVFVPICRTAFFDLLFWRHINQTKTDTVWGLLFFQRQTCSNVSECPELTSLDEADLLEII